jgi:hypothetical protein
MLVNIASAWGVLFVLSDTLPRLEASEYLVSESVVSRCSCLMFLSSFNELDLL